MTNQEAVKYQEALYHAQQLQDIALFNPNISVISAVGWRDNEKNLTEVAAANYGTRDAQAKLLEGILTNYINALARVVDIDDIPEIIGVILAKAVTRITDLAEEDTKK
ncbi:hypothetical protein HCA99_00270 [Listeria booriae]|uniref:hypothetical protein n=1 Tax=Listeria booriae TaxID=1552123 RepID=UPI0016237E88|nr:hypothetical protein [Listeria booriae]MBC2077641.1 hypothetical protein [Listeria booriae]